MAVAIEQNHDALATIIKGDVKPFSALYSPANNITIGNPFGPFAVGHEATGAAGAGVASRHRDGEIVGFERVATHVADTLASIVEIERFRVSRRSERTRLRTLRVTSLFRLEDNGWRLLRRHTDPITPHPAGTMGRTPRCSARAWIAHIRRSSRSAAINAAPS